VQGDQQGIVAGADLLSAPFEQAACVARGVGQLGKPQERHGEDQPLRRAHYASRSRNPAVKPGPRADASRRPDTPRASIRSSTNSTVTADMLP